jgi:ribosomal protein S18 acetylase RimI-like enzyme
VGSLDPLRHRFPWSAQPSDENPEIAPLKLAEVRDLRLPWMSRFSVDSLAAHIQANPGKTLWVPRTGEYVVAERWRHRDDIGNIMEVTARKGKSALVRAMLERLREDGCRLALLSDEVWNDQPRFYADLGFAPLEKIVFFQRDLKPNTEFPPAVDTLPVLDYDVAELADLELLIYLDHNSFPWLWWNSREDMSAYMLMNGVSVYVARVAGEPVGYASFTMYNGWAHLDRLAVISTHQKRKYGAAQLAHAMHSMSLLGATHVGLSTQENNIQSHHLYEGFGFKQTRDSMSIYGMSLESQGGTRA